MLRKDPPGGGGAGAAPGGDRLLPDRLSRPPGPGRRPLLSTFEGNNRQILFALNDSLNQVVKKTPNGNIPATAGAGAMDHMSPKSELSHSTPNLLVDSNKNANGAAAVANGNNNVPSTRGKGNRTQYNQLAMQAISKSIEQFAVSDTGAMGSNHCYVANGLEIEFTAVNKNMLQQLVSMGAEEVRFFRFYRQRIETCFSSVASRVSPPVSGWGVVACDA